MNGSITIGVFELSLLPAIVVVYILVYGSTLRSTLLARGRDEAIASGWRPPWLKVRCPKAHIATREMFIKFSGGRPQRKLSAIKKVRILNRSSSLKIDLSSLKSDRVRWISAQKIF